MFRFCLDESSAKKFVIAAQRILDRFAFKRPMGVVSRAVDIPDDPEIYGGLIVCTQGFGRLAFDEVNNTLVLFMSKFADDLKGERDSEGNVRPTEKGLEACYVIASKKHREGESILPPDRARFINHSVEAYCNEMAEHNANKFTLYAVQIEDQTLFTNNYVSYTITKDKSDKYTVRFSAPLPKDRSTKERQTLTGAFSRTFVQKQLGEKMSLAEAHEKVTVHWQKVSSRLWDHRDILEGEGLYIRSARFFEEFGRYCKDHTVGLLAATSVASISAFFNLGLVAGAASAYIVGHVMEHVFLKETLNKIKDWARGVGNKKKNLSVDRYGPDENVVGYYQDRSSGNPEKLCTHPDLKKCRPEDFRFLTVSESRPMLPDHMNFETEFRSNSIRGQALYQNERGVSSVAFFPTDRTMGNDFQTGLRRLVRDEGKGDFDLFVTYDPQQCRVERLRLSEVYRSQLGDTQIQHIIYNRTASDYYSAFGQQSAVTYRQMEDALKPKLFIRPGSMPENYLPPIARHFQAASLKSVQGRFDKVQKTAWKNAPLQPLVFPSVHAII